MPKLEKKKTSLDPNLKLDSCLGLIGKSNLEVALQICSKAIEKSPESPELLGERSLIYTLTGENMLACLDAENAFKMIQEKSKKIEKPETKK